MRKHAYHLGRIFIALCACLLSLATTSRAQAPNPGTTRSITFVPYQDTWTVSVERWWDIASNRSRNKDHYNQYNDWISNGTPNGKFGYAGGLTVTPDVVLTYDTNPGVPYFVGHIHATGLKPNFAYQLKLTGKPVSGPRGTGTNQSYVTASSKTSSGTPTTVIVNDANGNPTPVNGDDWTNQQLGYAGRWWDDSNASANTNAITDSVYQSNTTDTIYGYIYVGVFVTDKYGNYDGDFTGRYSYHITWQGWQNTTLKQVEHPKSPFAISGYLDNSATSHYYGYGSPNGPSSGAPQEDGVTSVRLYYEYESGRSGASGVTLANGTYHCRLLITEESFHNGYSVGTNSALGGKWKTVMATEDFDASGNPDGNSGNDIIFTIGAPSAPTNLTATPGNNQVTLNWTASSGATGYNVKRADTSGGPYTTLASNVAGTSFPDGTAINGNTYYYVVSALNAYGESPNSAQASATLQLADPPGKPTGLTATAGDTQVTLSWDATPGATNYWVKRSSVPGGPYTDISASETTSYTDRGLENGTTYYYVVSAENDVAEGPDSDEASATPQAPPAPLPPLPPTNLTATAVSASQINLAWTDNADNEDGFSVWSSTDGQNYVQIGTVGTNVTAYQNTGLVPSTTYYYFVRAFNAGGSADSTPVSATTLAPTPQPLTLPVAEDAYARGGTQYAGKNFNTTTLEVKSSTADKENRDAYLKFDLSNVTSPSSITKVYLRINAALSASGSVTTGVYALTNPLANWSETSLTWNTRPAFNATALTTIPVANTNYAWYDLDVTGYVKGQLSGTNPNQTITLVLHDPSNVAPTIVVNSKESGSNKPQLVVTY